MLRSGTIINPQLLSMLAGLGHGQVLVIADAGLPIGRDQRLIDLSLVPGLPSFADVATAVLDCAVFEACYLAVESADCTAVADVLAKRLGEIEVRSVTHEEFKIISARADAVIRTGECTPFANVALIAGTGF